MQGFWIKFTDGTRGYCEGQSAYDAVQIAEKLTGKIAELKGGNKWDPVLDHLPYPATPIIWQLDHPVSGKCPPFCSTPEKCINKTHCHKSYACTE